MIIASVYAGVGDYGQVSPAAVSPAAAGYGADPAVSAASADYGAAPVSSPDPSPAPAPAVSDASSDPSTPCTKDIKPTDPAAVDPVATSPDRKSVV